MGNRMGFISVKTYPVFAQTGNITQWNVFKNYEKYDVKNTRKNTHILQWVLPVGKIFAVV